MNIYSLVIHFLELLQRLKGNLIIYIFNKYNFNKLIFYFLINILQSFRNSNRLYIRYLVVLKSVERD
jgi:hypothetical protein